MRTSAVVPVVVMLAAGLAAPAQSTRRASLSSTGQQGNQQSNGATVSADGRVIAFDSLAGNLAQPPSASHHLYVHDRSTGLTTRVSRATDGTLGNQPSVHASLSATGRFVAFTSYATNLVPGDTNEQRDVFVHDRQTGETTRVSVSSLGAEGDNFSDRPSISADGRLVAFVSRATNLVPGDTNARNDIFVHDRQTGATSRVSLDSMGAQANNHSSLPVISADGRFVAFTSSASNLVANDTNNATDIFVHDRQTGATSRVSVSSGGVQPTASSSWPAISADGRFVAFDSLAPNLVAADTNALADVFLRDRDAMTTIRVSVDSAGAQGNLQSVGPLALSADGRYVVFQSRATNLVAGDTNGLFDVFIRDTQSPQTSRVSVSSQGGQADGHCENAAASADAGLIAFESLGNALVPGDTNNATDVFYHVREDCPGDGNADGTVDFLDLNAVLSSFGSCAGDPAFLLTADINADGCVDFLDLNAVLGFFGAAC